MAAFLFAIDPQVKIYLHTEAEQVWLLSPIQHAFLPLASFGLTAPAGVVESAGANAYMDWNNLGKRLNPGFGYFCM